MLRRKADFEAVSRQGRAYGTRLLALRWLRSEGSVTRFGLATPRAVGGAVGRNRLRRRLRALLRERLGEMGTGWDLLLIARPEAASASMSELRQALHSLLTRAGIEG
jgi:ribonuclease P protein component